jgi:hypothetical protein
MSIGCRDNNKSDVDIVTLDELSAKQKRVMKRLKGLYAKALDTDQASWQSARSFLPQSYQHSYHFGQNLLSLVSMRGFNASGKFNQIDNKEWAMSELYLKVIESVADKFPLIGEYLKVIHNNTEDVLEYITNIKFEDLSESDKKLFTDE